jgi:acyl-CoA thioesterase I
MNRNTSNQTGSASQRPSLTSGPITYVALGDSTGVGVGASDGGYPTRLFRNLEQRRPGSKLINLCVSGATTADILRAQLESGIRSNPDFITIGIGVNDIGHNIGLNAFASNYENILSRLKQETTALIVVSNIPDISTAPSIPNSFRPQYQRAIIDHNRKLDEIAAAHGVTVFDVYSVTRDELPKHPEYFSSDGFHPSDLGYALWAEQMWPTVAQTLGLDK